MSEPSTFKLGHRPALEGLRGVLIVLVVALHALHYLVDWHGAGGESVIGGAFMAVDVFFVLSGFLITSLLLEERRRSGTNSLRHFYLRRALRLLPALLATLALFGIYVAFSAHAAGAQYFRALAKLATYSANWFIGEDMFLTAWFGQSWSLAIEEQFYIVWPIALGLLVTLTRRRPEALVVGLGVAIVAVIVWRSVLFEMNDGIWSQVYFRTDTRLDQLFAGAAVAIAMHHGWLKDKARPWVGAAALAVFGALVVRGNLFEAGYYQAYAPVALLAAVGLIVGLLHDRGVARVFNLGPVKWFGQTSYTLYLVHVFVFNAVSIHMAGPGRNVTRVAVAVGIALGLTAFVHYAVERPALSLKDRIGSRARARAAEPAAAVAVAGGS